ncbi:glutathione-dependent formaldehyde-activating [Ramicandelaber brevisporus]|nr:glutathione-dependent formaldehyde-activating [Ramicandelaber brevisporus]
MSQEATQEFVKHTASCHCGTVRIEIDAPAELDVDQCNCSVCERKGFLHIIVPKSRMHILSGDEPGQMTTYTFGTHTAKHKFCSTCGISVFYIPRSNPDGFSVNARCIDSSTVKKMNIIPFNGRDNWEGEVDRLTDLSKE